MTDFIVVAGALAWLCLVIAAVATASPRVAARAWAANVALAAMVSASMFTAGERVSAAAWLTGSIVSAFGLYRARRRQHRANCALCRGETSKENDA